MSVMEDRPLRADARRNREAILKAARVVLAKHGTAAQMDDIARRAKVGVGTVYRHFPTKEALVRALIAQRMETIASYVVEALDDPDPWHGLTTSLWRGAELGAKDRALSQVFSESGRNFTECAAAQTELQSAAAELIRRGQAAGQVRPDARVDDIPVFMCGVTQAMHQMGHDPNAWRRHLQLIIDGLRAGPHNTPLA
jgi:AcrR family transcriptional regulator